jgi:hypothetical protein
MTQSEALKQFLDAAKAKGATNETLATLLRGRGWPEEDVYRALADHFESANGLEIPTYKRSGSAKDAFLYLLSFSTLATWTIGLGSIIFSLIDRWVRDPLTPQNYYAGTFYQIADSLACVIVAFPVYPVVMRSIVREVQAHPDKLESAIRKWLTYLALLAAAGVVVCDLITFLTYLLRGEVTARFVAKVATVLIISGGVFWYYLTSLQKDANKREAQVRRGLWASLAASVLVIAALIFGFNVLGGPGSQRLIQADRTIRGLANLAQQINVKWQGAGKVLPASLDQISSAPKEDPITHRAFVYHPKSARLRVVRGFRGSQSRSAAGKCEPRRPGKVDAPEGTFLLPDGRCSQRALGSLRLLTTPTPALSYCRSGNRILYCLRFYVKISRRCRCEVPDCCKL